MQVQVPKTTTTKRTTGVISSAAVLSEEGQRRKQMRDSSRIRLQESILAASKEVRHF